MATVMIIDEAGTDADELTPSLEALGLTSRHVKNPEDAKRLFSAVECRCVVLYVGAASADHVDLGAHLQSVSQGDPVELVFIIGPDARDPVVIGEAARALKPAEVFYGTVEAGSLAAYISRLAR